MSGAWTRPRYWGCQEWWCTRQWTVIRSGPSRRGPSALTDGESGGGVLTSAFIDTSLFAMCGGVVLRRRGGRLPPSPLPPSPAGSGRCDPTARTMLSLLEQQHKTQQLVLMVNAGLLWLMSLCHCHSTAVRKSRSLAGLSIRSRLDAPTKHSPSYTINAQRSMR
jgi:hypothetical protein